jgi:pyruvate formate lyase activating enzyme
MDMDVTIAALDKNSFVDYPGKIACVIFFQGCNYHCYYCHNQELIPARGKRLPVPPVDVFSFLSHRKGLLDGVVLSGGEPTLQPDLAAFTREVKALGYDVKLDTNGSRPEVLKALLAEGLLDDVAMDIKAPLSRYAEITGVRQSEGPVRESVRILKDASGKVGVEFRTTVAPDIEAEDIAAITNFIAGSRRYVLQQFRKPVISGQVVDYRNLRQPHAPDEIRRMAESIRCIEKVTTRGV